MAAPEYDLLSAHIASALDRGMLDPSLRDGIRSALGLASPARRIEALRLVFHAARARADASTAHLISTVESLAVLLSGLQSESGSDRPASEVFFSPGRGGRARLVELMGAVERSADICVFAITDDRIAGRILELHAAGNARIRIITDDIKSGEDGSDIGRFRKAGIPVLTDLSEAHMHHKFAVFDSRILVAGSYNWTRSAALKNQDDLMVLREPALVAAFAQRFELLWDDLGKEMRT